jgi:hypothetical protein
MALRAGLVASQRLWFTGVNGYGSCEREKNDINDLNSIPSKSRGHFQSVRIQKNVESKE